MTFKTDEELKVVRGLVHRMVGHALALDGTCKSLGSSGPPAHSPGSCYCKVPVSMESGSGKESSWLRNWVRARWP